MSGLVSSCLVWSSLISSCLILPCLAFLALLAMPYFCLAFCLTRAFLLPRPSSRALTEGNARRMTEVTAKKVGPTLAPHTDPNLPTLITLTNAYMSKKNPVSRLFPFVTAEKSTPPEQGKPNPTPCTLHSTPYILTLNPLLNLSPKP